MRAEIDCRHGCDQGAGLVAIHGGFKVCHAEGARSPCLVPKSSLSGAELCVWRGWRTIAARDGKAFIAGPQARPRDVWVRGEQIRDDTICPALNGPIQALSRLYDMQVPSGAPRCPDLYGAGDARKSGCCVRARNVDEGVGNAEAEWPRRARTFLNNQWPLLIHALDDGRLKISGNAAANAIRPFADAHRGAKKCAFLGTSCLLTETQGKPRRTF